MNSMTSTPRAAPPPTQLQKAERFAALHRGPALFVMPNPWDAGSALILAGLGFEALATSSAACAMALGRRDGEITRDEALAHGRAIVAATDLPVAADLENGFGHAPADAALTLRLAGEAGLVGGSIEDASGDAARPLYEFNHAVERVAAAAEAARAHAFPFTLTARTENYLRGKPDLDDTIRRLQAFEAGERHGSERERQLRLPRPALKPWLSEPADAARGTAAAAQLAFVVCFAVVDSELFTQAHVAHRVELDTALANAQHRVRLARVVGESQRVGRP